MPRATARANAAKSAIRARIEHVFAHQKNRFGLFIRTIGIKRAEAKLTLANLAYNFDRLNDGTDQQALRVCDDVPFATLDLLARVKAPWAATFCRFHTLAIDDTRAGRSFPTHRFTCH